MGKTKKRMMKKLRTEKKKRMMKKISVEDNTTGIESFLPQDLIIEILARLPVKELMRYRCVCKSWYDLTKSPNFINMHQISTKNHNNECILIKGVTIVPRKYRKTVDCRTILSYLSYEALDVISPSLEIPQFNDEKKFDVSWPCNGLLLCISYDTRTLVLCNPAIREFKLLPPRPFPSPDRWTTRVRRIGLCFDSYKNDYKVLAFVHHSRPRSNEYRYQVQIYNLSTNSWRQISTYPYIPDLYDAPPFQGVLFNGALHWVAQRKSILIDFILSFNVTHEVFEEMRLPDEISHNRGIAKTLTIVNNCLALFAYAPGYVERKFVDMWVMKEYNMKSWTKQVSVNELLIDDFIIPRLLWKNDVMLIQTGRGKLIKFELETNETTDTRVFFNHGSHGVMVYKESLVSVM